MSILNWPAELPKAMRAGYQSQRIDGRQRRSTASVGGYIGRFSQTATSTSMTVDVSRAEKGVFDLFYDEATGGATTPFLMPDATTDGWPMLDTSGQPISGDDGTPILLAATLLCLFGEEPPVETIVGVRFQIAFSVLVLP